MRPLPLTAQCIHGLSEERTALINNLINGTGWSGYFRESRVEFVWRPFSFFEKGSGFEQMFCFFIFIFNP